MPVHLISGGYANTYLIEDGDSLVAVDVGTAKAARKIYEYLSDKSIDASCLPMVIATHFHKDHVGGISRLVQLFPKIKVCFFRMVGDYLNGKEKICLFSPFLWLTGLLPVVMALDNHIKNTIASLFSDKGAIPLPFLRTKFLPSDYKAECILDEDQPIPYLPNWVMIKTPGHTADSVCFYSSDEKTIISGDTILNMKGSGELNNFCCNPNAIQESFKKLLPLNVRNIYPGHGRPLFNLDSLGCAAQ
jgi:glyoxylase-like metal-dependent hydrolase (beta-lactamase superfamily II)